MEYLAGNLELEDNPIEIDLWDRVTSIVDTYEGIMGYKIPSLGIKDNEDVPSLIIRSPSFGIVILDIVSEKIVGFDDDNEYWETSSNKFIYSRDITINIFAQELEGRLKKNSKLYDIRNDKWKIKYPIRKFIVFPLNSQKELLTYTDGNPNPLINAYITGESIEEELKQIFVDENNNLQQDVLDVIDSLLDGTDVFSKTKKVRIESVPSTMNDFIKKSLNHTFKLDRTQRQVALQVPAGPQRIRGLAGTGKTVILCMKAALAHKAFPNLKILFVFNTQSMYNQVKTAIAEYYLYEAKSLPNWDNLHVFHAWGGSQREGLYYNTANACGIRPKTYFDVKGSENPLEAVYSDLLKNVKNRIVPEYDIVLIDEAQDFAPSFFETIYYLTKPVEKSDNSKRIIWAYDEFQSLTELRIAQPEDLFGVNNGIPNMPNSVLEGVYKGKIQKDFVLPNSYRNPRINLMTAHGLALGLYSKFGKVPMEDRRDWEARGYEVEQPAKHIFDEGDNVVVKRPEEYSKNILEVLLKEYEKDDKQLISFRPLPTIKDELLHVVASVDWLINEQKVEPEEILIINLDTRSSKPQFEFIRQQLDIRRIKAITPGFVESTDAFKEKGFVTLSTPFRAKGNEANIVFIVNSQQVINDATFRMRNAIFVAITRSRGWCYIYSHGTGVKELQTEVNKLLSDYPKFDFVFPSEAEIKRKLTIINSHKDVEKADKNINDILSDDAYRALLLEKLAQDPKLLEEIKRMKKKD